MEDTERRVRVVLDFKEIRPIKALDLSTFIYDFNRLYFVSFDHLSLRRGNLPTERPSFGRNYYRPPNPFQLEISRIRFESPGLIEVSAAVAVGIAALWGVVQIIDKVSMWKLNRDKLRLENRKLALEIEKIADPELKLRAFDLHQQDQEAVLSRTETKSAIKQLELNSLKPHDLTVKGD